MDSRIKWLLLAVAAYLGYDWWSRRSSGAYGTSPPQAPPGTEPVTPETAAESPAQKAAREMAGEESRLSQTAADIEYYRRQGTEQDPIRTADDDTIAKMASTGQIPAAITESERRGQRFNYHQWNYFRAAALGISQPDPETFAAGRTGDLVGVREYLAARGMSGLSGYGELGNAYPHLMWIT